MSRRTPQPDRLVERTISFWRRKSGMELTGEEAAEVNANVTEFFQLLSEWERKEKDKNGLRTGAHNGTDG